ISQRTSRCGQRASTPKVRPSRPTAPVSELRRMKITVPTGWACKSGRQAAGNGRRAGAASIRAAARAVGANIAPGTLVEGSERRVVEASPHLRLPVAIEVFYGCLESTLLRRREDWSDPELQAGPHDAAQRILTVMAPLEDSVVVELGIGRQPEFAPVLHERLHGGFGGHQRLGPRAGHAPVQGDDVEDLNPHAACKGQPLDGVKAFEFGASCTHVGQIPARRRRRPAHAPAGIQHAVTLEDATDGPHRGHHCVPPSTEFAIDRPGSVLTQVTPLLECAAHDQHEVLYPRLSSPPSLGDGRVVGPIDVIPGKLSRPSEPPLHGGEGDAMHPRHRSHRGVVPNCRNHRASLVLSPLPFLLIASHPRGFSPSIATDRYWHSSDREVVAPGRLGLIGPTQRGDQTMSIISWIVLGLIAGFIGSKLVNKTGEGLVLDIALGIVGAVIGGWLFSLFGMHGVTGLNIYSLIVAIVRAVVFLVVYHAIRRRAA